MPWGSKFKNLGKLNYGKIMAKKLIKGSAKSANPLIFLARPERFELPTHGFVVCFAGYYFLSNILGITDNLPDYVP
jgi:hypothetical protein